MSKPYGQTCGTCIGSRAALTATIERESAAALAKSRRADRLQRRKERPHRLARLVEESIELRFAAARHERAALRARQRLDRIPPPSSCPTCGGSGKVQAPGSFMRGINRVA